MLGPEFLRLLEIGLGCRQIARRQLSLGFADCGGTGSEGCGVNLGQPRFLALHQAG